jgi:ferric-dicitrate binding protein FerR (iron transport regulator)
MGYFYKNFYLLNMNIKNRLLDKWLGKDAAEERRILNQWKSEAEKGIQKLHENWNPDTLITDYKSYKTVDENKAWEQLESRLEGAKSGRVITFVRRMAAVFLLLLMSFAGFYYWQQQADASSLIATNSHIGEHTLTDGTSVVLDQNTSLRLTESRKMELYGRCYFDVAKNPSVPFIVDMQHGKLEVLGTQFLISTSENKTTVYVHEGSVRVDYNQQSWTLSAGDKISMDKYNDITLSRIPGLDPVSWKSNQIVFRDESLFNVLHTLSLHFNLELKYPESVEKDDHCKINTTFSQGRIEDILQELTLIADLKYELNSGNLIVLNFKC